MKNVGIIISKLNEGGAERSASNLSLLLKNYYNVHLMIFDGHNIKYPYAGKVHNLQLPPAKNKILNTIKRSIAIKKIIKSNNIECCVSFMDGPNIVNVLSKGNNRVITSVRIHMSSSRKKTGLRGLLDKSKMKFIAKKSAVVVSLSDGVKRDLIENFGIPSNRIKTIYNPCDGDMLLSLAHKHVYEVKQRTRFVISTMGRLNEQKGQWHLIRAMQKVREKHPDVLLWILGEGELMEQLKDLTKELCLEGNVEFLGYIEAPHSYVLNSDLFVFPSLFEGLGNALLEAMACGVACISTDCKTGPREILAASNQVQEKINAIEYAEYGVLTSVCDKDHFDAVSELTAEEHQMAEAIMKLLDDEELRNHYKGQSVKRIADFSPTAIRSEWIKVIENE